MGKTYVYIISLILIMCAVDLAAQKPAVKEPPDTVYIPLSVRAGTDLVGPVVYFTDNKNLNAEVFISFDLNEKRSLFLSGGYSKYSYSQYNYSFDTHGTTIKAGMDFNLLKPQIAMGKYWAGIGLHYGLSSFSYEVPLIKYTGYWGTLMSGFSSTRGWAHFIEVAPGFRAKLFGNISLGWCVSLRKMIYTGVSKDTKPIYLPGFGNGSKNFSTGISYFIIWNIKYKTLRVLIPKDIPEEPVDENMNQMNGNGTPGNNPQMQP